MRAGDPAAADRATEWLTWQTDEPWFVSMFAQAPMEAALTRVLASPPDLVLLEGTPLARFLPLLPAGIPRVLDLFDVHSVITARAVATAAPGERAAAQREAERTLAFERDAVASCDACLAVSPLDAHAARVQLGASEVHVVPNGVDTAFFRQSETGVEPSSLVFTGRMSYPPNAEAAVSFARAILPGIRREVPDARLHIVGAAPLPEVTALASPSVVVHGQVDDVRPFLERAAVVVAPILSGGGTRVKVVEAAACGKAIVSTPLGIEGLDFKDGRDLLVADNPAAFAKAVILLLRDPARRAALGAAARQTATRYDWHAIGVQFRDVLERIQSRP
jgi:glycosyltransferase involved in cell wall biosynthesis